MFDVLMDRLQNSFKTTFGQRSMIFVHSVLSSDGQVAEQVL